MAGWIGAAASRRGTAHALRREPRQDCAALRVRGDTLVAVVADGAGSAPRGGAGAALACRILAARALLRAPRPACPGEDTVREWFGEAAGGICAAADRAGLARRDLATTAILLVAGDDGAIVGHVGDGAAVARVDGAWRTLSWPETGEHAGTTRFLTDDEPAVRVNRVDGPVSAVALLTDGIERLVLDLSAGLPHPPFFDMVAAPLDRLAADPSGPVGRHGPLSAALGRYLDGEAVCERTDDDKTLAVAVRRRETAP